MNFRCLHFAFECCFSTFNQVCFLFKSYLNNGTQKRVVNGSLSKFFSLGCGVPKSSVLGPLLFLIYINHLPNCLSFCQPRMYADDSHVTYADADLHSIQSSLNCDLSNFHKRLLCSKRSLNMTITEFILQLISVLLIHPDV